MTNNLPTTERTVVVRYDPDQGVSIAYHREDGVLVVTFGPESTTVEHLLMVLRREVEPATSGAPGVSSLARDQELGAERRAPGSFADHLLDADTDQ